MCDNAEQFGVRWGERGERPGQPLLKCQKGRLDTETRRAQIALSQKQTYKHKASDGSIPLRIDNSSGLFCKRDF